MADDSPIFFWKAEDAEFGPLCQWYHSPFESPDHLKDGKKIIFKNAEQYMMYRKAMHFNDTATANEILRNPSPWKCKGLGRSIKNFSESEWDKVKSQIVEEGSYLKFGTSAGKGGENLKQFLLGTGNRELVEASRFDRVWGVGFDAATLRQGESAGAGRERWGENRLGKALMVARERIKKEEGQRIKRGEEEKAELAARIRDNTRQV